MRGSSLVRHAAALAGLVALSCTLDSPTDPEKQPVFSVRVDDAAIAADGVSRTRLTITLAEDTPLGVSIDVSTDRGMLSGAVQAAAQALKFSAGSRETLLWLTASTSAGPATVAMKSESFFQTATVDFIPAPPALVLLSADVLRAPADGKTPIVITASALRLPGAGSVSLGTRVRIDVSRDGSPAADLSGFTATDDKGQAIQRLLTRVPGTCRVIASAGTVADTITVTFDPVP